MGKTNWLSVIGRYELEGETLVFKGGPVKLADGRVGFQVGNFICDRYFGGGNASTTIQFRKSTKDSAVALILYFDTPTGGFVTAQVGGPFLCSVNTFSGQKWTTHAVQGPGDQLEPDRLYHLEVRVAGSRVLMKLDGIHIVETNLSFPLPRGQTGVWAIGPNDIAVSDFDVRPEQPKLFVIMQFTPPFNELHSDVIIPVGREAGFSVVRADETYGPGIIIADIERKILEAKAIIADITPNNPNVYWEVGYAHALHKPTILIAERDTKLPFDVSPFRTLFYDNTIAGKSKIEEGLRKHFAAILTEWYTG